MDSSNHDYTHGFIYLIKKKAHFNELFLVNFYLEVDIDVFIPKTNDSNSFLNNEFKM